MNLAIAGVAGAVLATLGVIGGASAYVGTP